MNNEGAMNFRGEMKKDEPKRTTAIILWGPQRGEKKRAARGFCPGRHDKEKPVREKVGAY